MWMDSDGIGTSQPLVFAICRKGVFAGYDESKQKSGRGISEVCRTHDGPQEYYQL